MAVATAGAAGAALRLGPGLRRGVRADRRRRAASPRVHALDRGGDRRSSSSSSRSSRRWIAPYGFDQYQTTRHRFPQHAAPSCAHLFGTTVQSTDVLSRVVWGAQTELEVVVLALVVLAR